LQGRGYIYRLPQLAFTDSVTVAYATKGILTATQERKIQQAQIASMGPEPKATLLLTLDRGAQADILANPFFMNLVPIKSTLAAAASQSALGLSPTSTAPVLYKFVAFSLASKLSTPTIAMWTVSIPPGRIDPVSYIPTSVQPVWGIE